MSTLIAVPVLSPLEHGLYNLEYTLPKEPSNLISFSLFAQIGLEKIYKKDFLFCFVKYHFQLWLHLILWDNYLKIKL